MICFDSDYLHVELYETPNVLITQWSGPCTSQQYREALLRFNSLVLSHNIELAIADRRLLPSLSKEDTEWTLNYYLPLFVQLPLKRFAVLKSFDESAVRFLSNFFTNKEFSIPFERKEFDDLDSAYDWLVMVDAK
jgi:hypothetical protein